MITEHAKFEAKRRGIDLESVLSMIEHPQQTVPSTRNRSVLQGKYHDKIVNGEMLVRVIVESESNMVKVISVYKTSKIEKYWIGE